MTDLEIKQISRSGGLISARSDKGREALEKFVGVDFAREHLTSYGKAYDFGTDQDIRGLKVQFI